MVRFEADCRHQSLLIMRVASAVQWPSLNSSNLMMKKSRLLIFSSSTSSEMETVEKFNKCRRRALKCFVLVRTGRKKQQGEAQHSKATQKRSYIYFEANAPAWKKRRKQFRVTKMICSVLTFACNPSGLLFLFDKLSTASVCHRCI